jgi:hypothetical protein
LRSRCVQCPEDCPLCLTRGGGLAFIFHV